MMLRQNDDDKPLLIYVISDSLGDLGDILAKWGRRHFENILGDIKTYSFIHDKNQIVEIIDKAAQKKALLLCTVSSPNLLKFIKQKVKEKNVLFYDVLDPFLDELRILTGQKPNFNPVVKSELDEDYFKKVEAIEFTVRYDDGKRMDHLDEADIILLGVSRSSKTPISVYLANNNYKVANIPLMPEVQMPKELFEISNQKIFGLTINPDKLVSIREERLKTMKLTGHSNYASLQRVEYELKKAEVLFDKLGCTVIDVTSKAIEEIANFILATIMRR
ncbi:MAG: pyruvate, water dikinase regulatory protein [Eubacterium sp.]